MSNNHDDNPDYDYAHAHRLNAAMDRIRQDPRWEADEKCVIAGGSKKADKVLHGEKL